MWRLNLENEKDNWIKYAITAAAAKNQTSFAAAFNKKGVAATYQHW
ncbi:MAG: hypothetical protein WKG06_29280 [Segetibacter sp.]